MDEAVATAPSAASTVTYGSFLKNNLREYGMLMSLVVIMGLFQVLTKGTLLQPLNLHTLTPNGTLLSNADIHLAGLFNMGNGVTRLGGSVSGPASSPMIPPAARR